MSKIIEKSKEKLKQAGNYIWDHRGRICYIAGVVVMTVAYEVIKTTVENNHVAELEKNDMVDCTLKKDVAEFLLSSNGSTIGFKAVGYDGDYYTSDEFGRFGEDMKEFDERFANGKYTHVLALGRCEDDEF